MGSNIRNAAALRNDADAEKPLKPAEEFQQESGTEFYLP